MHKAKSFEDYYFTLFSSQQDNFILQAGNEKKRGKRRENSLTLGRSRASLKLIENPPFPFNSKNLQFMPICMQYTHTLRCSYFLFSMWPSFKVIHRLTNTQNFLDLLFSKCSMRKYTNLSFNSKELIIPSWSLNSFVECCCGHFQFKLLEGTQIFVLVLEASRAFGILKCLLFPFNFIIM